MSYFRCFVCNYISGKALDICPVCQTENAFVEVTEEEARKVKKYQNG